MKPIKLDNPKIISCPICNAKHYRRTQLNPNIHYERATDVITCPHIAGDCYTFDLPIESANDENFEGILYLPNLISKIFTSKDEFLNAIYERKPNYRIECNDGFYFWYFYFKIEDIGIMED